jgi:flagellar biosynthesis/type III secretory pathway chaperone
MLDAILDVKNENGYKILLDSLIQRVEEELDVYMTLKDILALELQALTASSLHLVNEVNAKKEDCLAKARTIEEERFVIVEKIAMLCGRKEKDVNFTFLIANADSGRASHLESLQEKLVPLIGEINRANEKNKGLLDFSMACVRGSIDFISSILSAGDSYGRSGQLKAENLNGRVVNSRG